MYVILYMYYLLYYLYSLIFFFSFFFQVSRDKKKLRQTRSAMKSKFETFSLEIVLVWSYPMCYGKIFNIDNNYGTVSFGWLDTDFDQSLYVIQVFRENGTQGSKVRFPWKMRHLKSDEVAIRSMPNTVLQFELRKNVIT